jgi:site-specific DNA-methyltransferase (adenine-specific)/modification methylase
MPKQILIHGDSADVLQSLNIEVDSCIVDPPYNTANKNTKVLKGRKALSSDFGAWDYFTDEEYLSFTEKWIDSVHDLIKPSGNLVVFSKLEYISDIIRIYEKRGFKHHATIIWHKTNPSPQIRKTGFLSSCEAILWATKGFDDKKISYTFNFSNQREMHNFIETPIAMGKVRTKHPTQKPKRVLERLLQIFTNEGDVILDCFAGSGTLADVCIDMGRSSINIERDPEYFEIMRTRVENCANSVIDPHDVVVLDEAKKVGKYFSGNIQLR